MTLSTDNPSPQVIAAVPQKKKHQHDGGIKAEQRTSARHLGRHITTFEDEII